jgi:class 3 adenylate cyclase
VVRAGQLIRAVTALAAPVSLQTRVGIATGLVVVGDLIGAGAAQEQAIVGETPNLAAHLRGNRTIIVSLVLFDLICAPSLSRRWPRF